MACNRDPSTNMLEVLDTWNVQSFKSNDVDSIQDVVLFSGNYSNGRITCRYTVLAMLQYINLILFAIILLQHCQEDSTIRNGPGF